jgi:hypothetical protein
MMRRKSYYPKEVTWAKDNIDLTDEQKAYNFAASTAYKFTPWLFENYLDALREALVKHGQGKRLPEDPEAEGFDKYDAQDLYGYFESYDIPSAIVTEYYRDHQYDQDFDEDLSQEYFDYNGLVKNQWLVHFTNDAWGIARNGFKYGVDDPANLALTTHLPDSAKKRGGYNFAFLATDNYMGYVGGRYGDMKYGKEAVVFRAGGIEVDHNTDNETQVIFWGASARDIVPITEDSNTGLWSVGEVPNGNPAFAHENLKTVVDWVIANYNQYKRWLCPQEPTAKPVPKKKQMVSHLRILATALRMF